VQLWSKPRVACLEHRRPGDEETRRPRDTTSNFPRSQSQFLLRVEFSPDLL
jgi:hypothetical protein